jgi:UDP-GlcNAc:undecaprenyl-phosphate GlcNAc-1-phosphate transferase
MQQFEATWTWILLAGFLLAAIIFAVYLARVRVYDDANFSFLREGNVTPVVADFMYKRRVGEVLLDLCLVTLAYYTAYHLRFDVFVLLKNYEYFLRSLPIVVSVQILALLVVGGYRGAWHQFGMMDAVVFAKGVFLGAVSSQIVLLYAYRFESYSRAVFVIYSALLLLLLCASRASFRLLGEFVTRRRVVGERCVVYGTGSASVATIREAFGTRPLRIVGFIDDDPNQKRLRVSGYPVLGNFFTLLELIQREGLDCVVLNTRMIDVDRLRELESACSAHDISLLRLQVDVTPFVAVS